MKIDNIIQNLLKTNIYRQANSKEKVFNDGAQPKKNKWLKCAFLAIFFFNDFLEEI